jgi:transcriptional regulator with XRE-family HTH domain
MPKTNKKLEPSDVSAIARRMRLLRQATGMSQAEFARNLGLCSVWNNVEIEFSRIGVDTAMKLVRAYKATYGIDMDWIYFGDEDLLRAGFRDKLRELEQAERDCQAHHQIA